MKNNQRIFQICKNLTYNIFVYYYVFYLILVIMVLFLIKKKKRHKIPRSNFNVLDHYTVFLTKLTVIKRVPRITRVLMMAYSRLHK